MTRWSFRRWPYQPTFPITIAGHGRVHTRTLPEQSQRWQAGCTNSARLTQDLRGRGYRGSERTVRRLIQTWRDSATPPAAVVTITPKPRQVTGWIIRPAADRADQEQTDLSRILDRCPILRAVDQLVADFGGIL